MARSPFPRPFLVLLSALALILISMEGAAAAGNCDGIWPVGSCVSSENCAEGCDNCWWRCTCCLSGWPPGRPYWNGPFENNKCTIVQDECGEPPCDPSCQWSDVCDESAPDGCGGTCTRDTDGTSCGANGCVGTEARWNFRCSGGTCIYDSLGCSCGCSGGVCKNPDTDQLSCETDCPYKWMAPGEFESQPPQAARCCGDDASEYFITLGVGPDRCCNATTDCVDSGGACQVNDVWSPGGCTDGIDNNCNGPIDGDDPACRATLSGIVTDDEDTPIENATVTAVGWDPVTGVYVNFTDVTLPSGEYGMSVIVNLTYDIVVKVPGYGTGFEWSQNVGDDGRSINFKIKKAENCEDDCTSPGESLCRPDCWGVNNCEYFNPITFGVCADGVQKDWILPIPGTDSEVQCCDGAPVQRKRTQIVGISGAESVVRVTRIISYAGQLITLVIDVFK